MKKALGYLGLTMVLLLMVTAVLTYLAPHLGWRVPNLGYGTKFIKTSLGFVLCLVVPTLIFITVYVRIIWKFLHEDRTQNLSETTS
ncbi:hypothetical protein ACFLU1_05000 [Chloroflexota bacterium]